MKNNPQPHSDIDNWVAGLQNKPIECTSPVYQEGRIIRDLVQEYAKERQEQQWNKVLQKARHDGLLDANPLANPTAINPSQSESIRWGHWIASNESRFLWIAASIVVLISIGIYLFLGKSNDDKSNNTDYLNSREGLMHMRGANQEPQFIPIPKNATPKNIAMQVENIFERYEIKYEPPFEASGGRIQFLAVIPENSPAIPELEKIGITIRSQFNSKDIKNFVLVPYS